MYRAIYTFLLLSILIACREEDFGDIPFDPDTGWFPDTPANIAELNTRFDEYSTTITGSGMNIQLYYSANFEKKGADFDIDGAILIIDINEEQNTMKLKLSSNKPPLTNRLLPLINTAADEHGPLAIRSQFGSDRYFLFANNKAGQYEIEYAYQQSGIEGIQGPFNATVLNSNVCDFYPTINKDQTKMLFSSYRGKKYDIYEIEIEGNDFIEWLNTGTNEAVLNSTLSSDNDDKCPSTKGNVVVFASNRNGGYGGYDLWYSVFKDNEWGTPVNFGPEINTEHHEFGPSIESYPDSENDLMIFSSNRPGGKGGYDLYFVGIPRFID